MKYRLTAAVQADISSTLAWSEDEFGAEARRRYAALIAAAIRDAASGSNDVGLRPRPELGDGVFSWHLSQSRHHSPEARVRHPRHLLICRRDRDTLIIGRVLHDAMDLQQHRDANPAWERGDEGPGASR